jgi:hypothetical protein
VKETAPGGIFEVHVAVHGAEGEGAAAVHAEADAGGLDQVEIVAVPQVGFDDPPRADERVGGGPAHAGASANSFGKRTRL